MLDSRGSVALYSQIMDDIRAKVASGEMQPGEKLPSEVDLAASYGVNRFTARHALTELVSAGVVFRVPGRGTFIAQDAPAGQVEGETRSARRTRVMLSVPNIGNSFLGNIVEAVQATLDQHGFDTVIRSMHTDRYEELRALQRIQESKPVALIHVAAAYTEQNIAALMAINASIPVVVVDGCFDGLDAVVSDDRKGACQITNHLIELGHRCILHLQGAEGGLPAQERLAGYQDALAAHGIAFAPHLVRPTIWDITGGYCETKKAFISASPNERPTAIFACNDLAAIGAYRALGELGIATPSEVAVAGYGNLDISSHLSPALTTVDQGPYDMGRIATHLVMDKLSGQRPISDSNHVILPPKLIMRDSCGIRQA